MFDKHHCPYCSVDTHAKMSALFLIKKWISVVLRINRARSLGAAVCTLDCTVVSWVAWALTTLLCCSAMSQKAERVQIRATSFIGYFLTNEIIGKSVHSNKHTKVFIEVAPQIDNTNNRDPGYTKGPRNWISVCSKCDLIFTSKPVKKEHLENKQTKS